MRTSRWLCAIGLCVAVLVGLVAPASSQAYPSRSIRIVLPITPGSVTDVAARLIAQELSDRMGGVSVIIDNRPGAGSVVATQECVRAAPDGYTLCLLASDIAYGPFTIPNLPFNPVTDLRAVSNLYTVTEGLFARKSLAANTISELKAMAVAKPDGVTFAALGLLSDIFREWINDKWKVQMVGVPYKGGSEVVSALLSESVDIGRMGMGNAVSQLGEGKLKILAAASKQRSEMLPNTQTLTESELGDYPGVPIFWGVFVPAQTPDVIVNRINSELVQVVRGPKFVDFAKKQYLEIEATTPKAFEDYLAVQRAHSGALIQKYRPSIIPAGVTIPALPAGASKS